MTRRFRVLITRPRLDARPFARALRDRGVGTLTQPLLNIVPLPGPAIDLSGCQAIAATSANGVRAFVARSPVRDLLLFAVGDGTARIARHFGFRHVMSASGDVSSLAELLAATLDPAAGAILHVAGSDLAGDLAGLLAAAGLSYRREVLYRAEVADGFDRRTAAALRAHALDGATFFSPRTGRTFARLAVRDGLAHCCQALTAFCLSAAVVEAIATVPWKGMLIADRPDQPAMVDIVAASAVPGVK